MRPFPEKELLQAASSLKSLAVFDRSVGFNMFGPVFTEIRGALSSLRIPITDHIGGLGGRDLTHEEVREMYDVAESAANGKNVRAITWHGLRGEQS